MGISRQYKELQNIQLLSEDRELVTPELQNTNDYYGFAAILKKYCGINNNYQLKAVLEHAPYLVKDYAWDSEYAAPFGAIISASKFRDDILKTKTDKKRFVIGPAVAYADGYLNPAELNQQRVELGRNLLVFPAHSTHHLNSSYNLDRFFSIVKEIGEDFDSTSICLYWKDVLNGTGEKFKNAGFNVVTAGHVYDPLFFERLRSIIELSAMTVSNNISTHIGYCIYFNKPHYIIEDKISVTAKNQSIIDTQYFKDDSLNREIQNMFGEYAENITGDQFDLAEYYWGINQVKNKQELLNIFSEAEEIYNNKNIFQPVKQPEVKKSSPSITIANPPSLQSKGSGISLEPVSRLFGSDRMQGDALPLCWYYIRQFLNKYQNDVQGRVLEIAENTYTKMFGKNRVTKSDILHADSTNKYATIVGDLTNAKNIADNSFDCIILTQTLQCIYDLKSVIKEVYRILKPNGIVLVTNSGISQISRYDMDRWGDYWRLTTASAQKLFEEYFPKQNVIAESYGNVRVSQAYLDGLVTSDLNPEILNYKDDDYQMIVTVRAQKPVNTNSVKVNDEANNTIKSKSDVSLITEGWDNYAKDWKKDAFKVTDKNKLKFIGDEWTYEIAGNGNINYGLPESVINEFDTYIEKNILDKYLPQSAAQAMEIGPGGGRFTKLLVDRTKILHLSDSSDAMLDSLKQRFSNRENLYYHYTPDGKTLPKLEDGTLDFVISLDVFVHFEPRLVYWYLTQIVKLLKNGGTGIIHYANPHSEIGWKQFQADLEANIDKRSNFAAFGVMSPYLMELFLTKLECEIVLTDTNIIPRDAITIFKKRTHGLSSNDIQPGVLLYHRVADLNYDYNLLAVSPANFESHLKIIKNNYLPVSVNELINRIRSKTLKGNEIAITFDDGYYDNYKNALPLLEKYSIPATIFVTTGYIEGSSNTWWDDLEYIFLGGHNLPPSFKLGVSEFPIDTAAKRKELLDTFLNLFKDKELSEITNIVNYIFSAVGIEKKYRERDRFMTKKELIALNKSPLITIGSHTVSHTRLSILNNNKISDEIIQSKKYLENLLKGKIEFISYPYGTQTDYNAYAVDELNKNGYTAAFSNFRGTVNNSTNIFEIPRFLVRNWNEGEFDNWRTAQNKSPFETAAVNKRNIYFA